MSHALVDFTIAAALLAFGALAVQRLRLPPLPAYLLVGLAAGTGIDVDALEPLPSIGLLLLLFSVGQEFGPDRVKEFGRKAWRAGLWDLVPLPVGTAIGLALGLDLTGAVFLGGVFYISSSAVIAKLLIDLKRTGYPESDVVLGVLVLEDLVIALVLTLFAAQAGVAGLVASVVLAAAYLAVSQWLAPRLAEFLESLADEVVLLLAAAFTAGTALLFAELGASEAVGAFLCGIVAAGLGIEERVERLIGPIRDLAVAFFFFTVGAGAIGVLADVSVIAVGLAVLLLAGKLPFDYLAGRAAGLGVRRSVNTAIFLVPRGEFNLVIAALALEGGRTLVAQVAVLAVLISVPLASLVLRYELMAKLPWPELLAGRRVERGPAS